MGSKVRVVMQPEYVQSFVCNGIICEDNCCIGKWNIYVGKEHFLKYKNVKGELHEKFTKVVKKNRSNPTEFTYGKLKLDPILGHCVFLTEDRMCEVQLKLGAEYLCDTCMFYPRDISKVDAMFERSLSMSCPLAAKLALLNPNPMAFEQVQEDAEKRIYVNRGSLATEGHLKTNSLEHFFWDIRMFSIDVLQNRNYSIGDRLTLIGIAFKRIQTLQSEKRLIDLPKLLDTLEGMIKKGEFNGQLDEIPRNSNLQMKILKEISDTKMKYGSVSERYTECFTEMLLGLNYDEEFVLEESAAAYEIAYNEYYKDYIDDKSYILENYMVNEFFKEKLPFGIFGNIWDAYVFFCVLYGMIKLHLIGIASYQKGLDDDMVIKLIQSLTKVVVNDQTFIKDIIKIIKDSELDSLAHMVILVRN